MQERFGVCIEVLSGDTIRVDDGGKTEVRYCNVWAPALGTPLGDALLAYNRELVLGKPVCYLPNGHIHWESNSIVSDVWVDGLWLNQHLRNWLGARYGKPEWRNGTPGAEIAPPVEDPASS